MAKDVFYCMILVSLLQLTTQSDAVEDGPTADALTTGMLWINGTSGPTVSSLYPHRAVLTGVILGMLCLVGIVGGLTGSYVVWKKDQELAKLRGEDRLVRTNSIQTVSVTI